MFQGHSTHTAGHYDLAIIGSGIAGMAASLYAANRGLSTLQVGNVGGIIFASGLLDLMAVLPSKELKVCEDPWKAIEAHIEINPRHPYSKISKENILASIDELLDFFNKNDFQYRYHKDRNSKVITSLGTIKYSYCVPKTMWANEQALEKKEDCLIVDFKGLKEFSARQIAETLRGVWPNLRSGRIVFPGTESKNEIFTVHCAQALEIQENRTMLAELIKPLVGSAKFVGLPAVLGIKRTGRILEDLTARIGAEVFEIPTMPASVPGLRMKEFFDSHLPAMGVHRLTQKRVSGVTVLNDGSHRISLQGSDTTIQCRGIILATGRFMGKGLVADRTEIRETLFGLPVFQPENRELWHQEDFLDPSGHAVNSSGVEIDDTFHPIDANGGCIHPSLFAIGSILAHQDWMRTKSGSGLALATAYAAANAFCNQLKINSGMKNT